MSKRITILLLFLSILSCAPLLQAKSGQKTLFIPQQDIEEHGFNDPEGAFGYDYKAESENLAIFWAKSFGKDPASIQDENRRFFPQEILEEGERYYRYFIDKLKFVLKGKSYTDRYKTIIWMYDDDVRTAYGGAHDSIGMVWFRPCRISGYPYCTLVHELGHAFQYMVKADGYEGFSSTLMEYTSQWMLWQLYPDWVTIENYHLNNYMKQTHYALFHKKNLYCTPQFLEYWTNKHGVKLVGELWRNARKGETPESVYMRLTGLSYEQLNDEIYDAASRFVTWDIPRIKSVCSSYANQHLCKLERQENGWYRIAQEKCPQSGGYNAIRMKVPRGGTRITLTFEGLAGHPDFNPKGQEEAGWRYGFIAMLTNGKRVYGEMHKAGNGINPSVHFTLPEKTQFLWLVVTGAPRHAIASSQPDEPDAEFPYQIQTEGTAPHASML